MKLTSLQRRERIYKIAESDPDYQKMKAEYDRFQKKYTSLTDRLPKRWSVFLWNFPGMGYLLHHKLLNIVCEHMRFPDET